MHSTSRHSYAGGNLKGVHRLVALQHGHAQMVVAVHELAEPLDDRPAQHKICICIHLNLYTTGIWSWPAADEEETMLHYTHLRRRWDWLSKLLSIAVKRPSQLQAGA